MKLLPRLSLAVAGAVALVPAVSAWIEVREQREILAEAALDDRYFVWSTVQELLDARDFEDPSALVSRIEDASAPGTIITFSPLTEVESEEPIPSSRERHTLEEGKVLVRPLGDRMRTIVPVVADPLRRALVIDEPRESHEAIAEAAVGGAVATGIALALAAALLGIFLWNLLVVRPAAHLADLADRLAAGDLSARTEIERTGPISALGQGMNVMAARLDEARRSLASAASERTLLLEELRHADRLRTVGQIAASLAHELGTPLNTVSGHARLVERSAVADDAVKNSARVITEQTRRMAELVRDLLDYGRRSRTERRAEPPEALVAEAMEMLSPLANKRGITLALDTATCPAVLVDRAQILQVLTNLIVNAMHASDDRGQIEIVMRGERAARVGGQPSRPMVRISIVDHGVGISPDDLTQIFEPFFTHKPAGDGTGLGLPIARGIVEEHEGWMSVESTPGQGATFSVYLPVQSSDQGAALSSDTSGMPGSARSDARG